MRLRSMCFAVPKRKSYRSRSIVTESTSELSRLDPPKARAPHLRDAPPPIPDHVMLCRHGGSASRAGVENASRSRRRHDQEFHYDGRPVPWPAPIPRVVIYVGVAKILAPGLRLVCGATTSRADGGRTNARRSKVTLS
jgi:hypothetical protein